MNRVVLHAEEGSRKMLKIPQHILNEMITHAREDFPLECCGILAGKNEEVEKIYRVPNKDQSRVSYLMDPKEQIRVFKEMRQEGLELKAIYHSHPNHPAYPSQTDVKLAFYPEAVYVIISINDKGSTEVKGFRIVDKTISEEELQFI